MRRLLLATAPPNDTLEFPITLVEGDNGELGVIFFNWIKTNMSVDNYGCGNLSFDSGDVIIEGHSFDRCSDFGHEDNILFMPAPSGYLAVILYSDGRIHMSED